MKKRHQQKLIILSIGLFIILNIPFILIFNVNGSLFGIPVLYFSIYSIWLFSVVITFIVVKKYYE